MRGYRVRFLEYSPSLDDAYGYFVVKDGLDGEQVCINVFPIRLMLDKIGTGYRMVALFRQISRENLCEWNLFMRTVRRIV